MNGYGRGFFGMPPVVKNIIMLNILMFVVYLIGAGGFGIDLNRVLGLYFPKSEMFRPYQLVTHMFMHANFMHIFFNMYALFIFGQVLENVWGPKRFFIFYFVCGLGAALTHETAIYFQYLKLMNIVPPEQLQGVLESQILYIPTVGASGAIFGVLLGFGILFPNTQLMLLFPPIPIKAKWFVLIYGGIEFFLAIWQPGSKVAHTAHLGGMLFAYILIKYWQKTTKTLY